VLLAVIFAATRLLLPYADQYNAELGARIGDYLGQPVRIRNLDAEWHGVTPELVLKDVSLLDAIGEQPVLRFDTLRLGLDIIDSLRHWQLVFSRITVVGATLQATRHLDGRITMAGLSADGGDTAENIDTFAAWFFSQGHLSLEDSDITWHDQRNGGRILHFSAANITLRNAGDRHQLDASVLLPGALGRSLNLHLDIRGDPLHAEGRHTRAYFSGEQVRLIELLEAQPVAGVAVDAGATDFGIWAEWTDGRLQNLQGDVYASDLVLHQGDVDSLALERLAGYFHWQREARGWRFDGDNIVLAQAEYQWQPARVMLRFDEAVDGNPVIEAYASHLQLEDVTTLLTLFKVGGDTLQQPLQALKPRGRLLDAHLLWRGDVAPNYQIYARLQNAEINAWRAVPEAWNVDGQLWLDSKAGQVKLERAALRLVFDDLFRNPLQVDELRGRMNWALDGESLRVSGRELVAANTDIRVRATLDVIHDTPDASPFVSLVARFEDGDGSRVSRYLPTGIMPPVAVDWLDQAIIDARVTSGSVLLHGRLAEFPFDTGNGRFEVRFGVENGSFNYVEDWPPLTAIHADVAFEGRSMTVEARDGRVISNQIRRARVHIPDMTVTPMALSVVGEVWGATQEKLDYLVASPPLYESFGRYLENMHADGESLLYLDLGLFIGALEKTSVRGWVELQDDSLSIPSLGRVLDGVTGRLQFSNDGLQAEEIRADLLGQDTRIAITTDDTATGRRVRMTANGMFDAPDLAARYLPEIHDLLVGTGDWNIRFEIPLSETNTAPPAALMVVANLRGVESRLPVPLLKSREADAVLNLKLVFPARHAPLLRLGYAGFINGIFELGGNHGLQRGELRLGGGSASLPDAVGLRLVGWLDTLSLDDWRNVWPSVPTEDAVRSSLPHSIDVAVRLLKFYGQQLHNTHLKLQTEDNVWLADVDGEEVKGRLRIPRDLRAAPVEADLDYCYLTEPQLVAGSIDPRNLPALSIRSADFRYKQLRLGSFQLDATRVVDGLRVEQLIIKPRATTITTRGGWYISGDEQRSTVQMHVKSSNAGKSLKALGYVGVINSGRGNIVLELQWPGSFADLDVAQMRGSMYMVLRDGQLLDINPGAGGRIFGMLSLQTLPRRLFLDFSDVFKKGFRFDKIRGDFRIEEGDAYTSNLYMKGPAARVDIAGRIGLEQQDYDQLVTVTPKVTESLPIIGALAAAPQVGVAILFMQKLFQPQIEGITRTRYTVTGNWNNPQVQKLGSAPTVAPLGDEDM
jgi:uncharacterized protein (TIGR02099 family)